VKRFFAGYFLFSDFTLAMTAWILFVAVIVMGGDVRPARDLFVFITVIMQPVAIMVGVIAVDLS
jgi:hypothetical protein